MSSLYQGGKIWWLRSTRQAEPRGKARGTSDKAEARRLLKDWEGQITKGEIIPKLGRVTWDKASTDLRGYYQAYGT